MTPKIYLVSPHSKCVPNVDYRTCDLVALPAVDSIIDRNNKNRNARLMVQTSTIFRSDGDFNRMSTNDHPWRQDLRKNIKKFKPDFIIEAHSFMGTKGETHLQYIGDQDVLLISNKYNHKWIGRLVELIRKKWPDIQVRQTSTAIPDSALYTDFAHSYQHVLFEFNEQYPDRTAQSAQAVYDAVVEFVSPPSIIVRMVWALVILLFVLLIIYIHNNETKKICITRCLTKTTTMISTPA
jgi:hypothetical protein